jgi:hypothetical protein
MLPDRLSGADFQTLGHQINRSKKLSLAQSHQTISPQNIRLFASLLSLGKQLGRVTIMFGRFLLLPLGSKNIPHIPQRLPSPVSIPGPIKKSLGLLQSSQSGRIILLAIINNPQIIQHLHPACLISLPGKSVNGRIKTPQSLGICAIPEMGQPHLLQLLRRCLSHVRPALTFID